MGSALIVLMTDWPRYSGSQSWCWDHEWTCIRCWGLGDRVMRAVRFDSRKWWTHSPQEGQWMDQMSTDRIEDRCLFTRPGGVFTGLFTLIWFSYSLEIWGLWRQWWLERSIRIIKNAQMMLSIDWLLIQILRGRPLAGRSTIHTVNRPNLLSKTSID